MKKSKILKFCISEEDKNLFFSNCKEIRETPSEILRYLVNTFNNTLDGKKTIKDLKNLEKKLWLEVNAYGNNINQIAKHLNTLRKNPKTRITDREFRHVEKTMNDILGYVEKLWKLIERKL